MIRQDRYQVGDQVEFIDIDPDFPENIHNYELLKQWKKDAGPSQYLVTKVQKSGTTGHTQLVTINDDGTFSGYWFKPLREPT